MGKIAVAGGTGNVGKTIVEVLAKESHHEICVFSRKEPKNPLPSGVKPLLVNYEDVDELKAALEDNQIDTIVCCLSIVDETVGKSQLNLIKAAEASKTTKRFVASEWGLRYPPGAAAYLPFAKSRVDAVEQLRRSGLKWTDFSCGYFMDYFSGPGMKSNMPTIAFALDIPNKFAAIPGSGNEPITFTYTFDLAKFVAELMDVADWPEESIVIGDKVTWNEFLKMVEEVTGSKFEVHYDSVEKLRTFRVTELPSHVQMYPLFPKAQVQQVFGAFGWWMAEGMFDLPMEDSLNAKFPNVKTLKVKEMLDKTWKTK